MASGSISTVFWEWCARAFPYEQQIAAAAAGGFDVFTIPNRNYRRELAAGRTARDMLSIAADRGVTLDYLDGTSCWAPIRYPRNADDFIKAALDFSADEAFATCEALGLKHIVAIAGFEPGDLETPILIDAFGKFCDRAAEFGIWVDLEPMPMMGIPTLAMGWDIVRQADRENSGVLLDTWHFMRGDPDFKLLEAVPRGRIVTVQLADGGAKPKGDSLWEDAMHHRIFPGEGELPIVEILRVLDRGQDLRSIGPELLSDEIDKLTPEMAGRRSRETMDAVLKEAGIAAA
jgi:4-hydroxyphenylpyruvate dioxygenase